MVEPPKIRDDGFFGGRCEPVKLMYDYKHKEVKGKYIDVVSLYPTVMYCDRYPVGHPSKISRPVKYDNNWFGFVYCKVLPPKLYIYQCYRTNRRPKKQRNYSLGYAKPVCLAYMQNAHITILTKTA